MVRPKKFFKTAQNKESVQCYIDGVYVGSISKRKLCLLVEDKKRLNTPIEGTQVKPVWGGYERGDLSTVDENLPDKGFKA